MKKNSFIFLIIVALFTCAGQTFAASIGDSITPVGRHKVTFSLEDNSIFQRQITKSGTLTEFSMNNTNQVYGKLTFGLSDNINLYGKIGESDGGKLQLSYSDTGSTTVYAKPGFFSG
ncbi:MAG: hypothetical protein WCG78_08325, partial [Candidatus Omnitrophota bacterium]